MLEWIYYIRSKDLLGDYAQQEGPEDTPFTKAIRNELVKGKDVCQAHKVRDFMWEKMLISIRAGVQ